MKNGSHFAVRVASVSRFHPYSDNARPSSTINVGSFTVAVALLRLSISFPLQSAGSGIANDQRIVGSYTYGNSTAAFLYENGIYTSFTDPEQTKATRAYGINDKGQIFGTYDDPQPYVFHAFLKTGDTYITIDYPGATSSAAWAINDNGMVVGTYQVNGTTHGFTYLNGTFTTLDLPGAAYTEPTGINNNGDIVGTFYYPGRTIMASCTAMASFQESAILGRCYAVLPGSITTG